MLHSKLYYMELSGGNACAFVGSHNLTAYALTGLNGEAGVLLEGPANAPEFDAVRSHIDLARRQAVPYSPDIKEAYAWWIREYLDGLRAEMGLPHDWTTVRTIIIFAASVESRLPGSDDRIYFEIPAGIEQIESLKT